MGDRHRFLDTWARELLTFQRSFLIMVPVERVYSLWSNIQEAKRNTWLKPIVSAKRATRGSLRCPTYRRRRGSPCPLCSDKKTSTRDAFLRGEMGESSATPRMRCGFSTRPAAKTSAGGVAREKIPPPPRHRPA